MNKLKPLVTICTLVHYTHPDFVISAIESIFNQTYINIEHIIVNDAPDDNQYWPQIKKYLIDNNLPSRIIEHEVNFGVCKTLNQVLEISNGKYFCGCSDDVFLPNKINIEVDTLEKLEDNYAATYSDAFLINEQGLLLNGMFIEKHRNFKQIPEEYIFEHLLEGNFLPIMSMLFKTQKIREVGGFDESLIFEDYDLHLRLFKKYKIKYIKLPLSKYRIHSSSLSNNIKDWTYEYFKIYKKHLNNIIILNKYKSLKENVILNFNTLYDLTKYEVKVKILWYFLHKLKIKRSYILKIILLLQKLKLKILY